MICAGSLFMGVKGGWRLLVKPFKMVFLFDSVACEVIKYAFRKGVLFCFHSGRDPC